MSSSMGAQSQPSPAAPLNHKPQRILACVLCQHRKIKCDRVFPCSNCTKNNTTCTPSTPAPARKRRRPNQDLQERLARCEELLKEYTEAGTKKEASVDGDSPASLFTFASRSGNAPAGTINNTLEQPDWGFQNGVGIHSSVPGHQSAPRYHDIGQHHGKLVKEDGGIRFMDSIVLGTIYEELRAMRDIVNASDDDEPSPDTVTPDSNPELLIGAETPSSSSPEELWPNAGHVFRLWQIYLDRVNPLTKVIHVPTLQPYVVNAISGCSSLPKNYEALLFSIWLMAAVAMAPEECEAVLGYSREVALRRFSSGVRMALVRLNFLKTHEMVALQALVIYLISLQGRYNRHAAWVLNGVVIRIAQKMGLHRDGEQLGLGPFECEMRRRLWWQIIMLDAKYAMMTGLTQSLLPRVWDTKEPKNLNDADMYPTAAEPFQDREGPTEMIFVLICNKIARFLCETPSLEMMLMLAEWSGEPRSEDPRLAEFRQVISKLGQDLLLVLNKYCDPTAGPVHLMAQEVEKQILQKLKTLITPAKDQPEWGIEIVDQKDNAFKIAVCALEHEEENYITCQDKGFLWHAVLHFQPDVFIYVAGQLCHRLQGTLVERAWKQVEVVYHWHPELYDTTNKTHSTLARFILKAWGKRQDILFRKMGQRPEPPECIKRLQRDMPYEDVKSEPITALPADMGGPSMPRPDMTFTEPAFDQFFGPFLGGDNSDWDMFNGLPGTGQNDLLSTYYGMGPPSGW